MPPPVKSRILPTLPPFHTFPPCFPADMICSPKPFLPTPTPTLTPTVTPTFQPTATPEPTPQDIIVYIDCKNGAGPGLEFSPVNFACFGRGNLPKSFPGKIGPATPHPFTPWTTCTGYPQTEVDLVLTRVDEGDWLTTGGGTGRFVWSSPIPFYGGLPVAITADPDKIIRSTVALADATEVYNFTGSLAIDSGAKASCTFNKETGEIKFNYSGTTCLEPVGYGGLCCMPYKIEYTGTLPPEPIPPSPIPTSPPTPLPTQSPTPLPTRSPTPTPIPTRTFTPTPSPSQSATPTPTPSPT